LRRIRIALLGDELVTGAGDPKKLGWVGRIKSRLPAEADVECFELAWPAETSAGLLRRWREEALPRFAPETENYLMIALGSHDIDAEVSISRSRLNLASILDDAAREGVRVFVVGPIPRSEANKNVEIAALNSGFQDVTTRRGLNYVDCFSALIDHEAGREIDQSVRGLPGQVGYGVIAWMVLNRGWLAWLGLDQEQTS
jgi:lysophospholipase L1-like esterase